MKSIRNKILIPVILLVVLTTVSILAICITRFTSYINATVADELESASKNLTSQLDSYKLMSAQAAQLISTDAHLTDYIKNNDRENIINQSQRLQTNAGMDFCTILDNEGNVIARAHEPDNFGDSLANQQNIQSAMKGESATFVEKGSAVKLSVRSSAPILDDDGVQIAIVSVGCRLDQDSFVDKMKNITGTEVTVFLGDERIATTVIGADGKRAVGTKANEDISAQVLGGEPYTGEALVVGQNARVKYTPIEESGKVIGMLFVGQYTKPTDDAVRSFVLLGVIVGAAAILIGIIAGAIISGRIVKPVLKLVEAGDRISLGDIDVDVSIHTKDEIQKLVDSFNRIIAANRSQAEAIRAISHGDLTVDVEPRSDRDVVNHSLKDMLEMNNEAFSNITQSAERVARCARDISQGAERLASSSTEQAASVEELSAASQEVSTQAENNAKMAGEGRDLGDSITKTADIGSEQMRNMSKAVSDINEASLAIESVIKAIDDIAFQTNLLALNASVEAARAGVHGKGFAVVADEVRNLAGKSAAAAKGTDELIANSVSKAKIGSAIAKETSESLNSIVEGVKKNNRIMSVIAEASEKQNAVITQISAGINDVSQIVQQNSATAEQSAAASAVMSNEADELMRLVSRFRLRDPSGRIPEAPVADQNGFSL